MAKLNPGPLTPKTFSQAIQYLCDSDPDLAHILTLLNPPPFWTRKPGFASLMGIILEQQVSLASARASFDRLLGAASPLTPDRFLELDDARLKSCGFSRQKTAYGRNLAKAIVDRHLNLSVLNAMPDKIARSELVKVKGIGIIAAQTDLKRWYQEIGFIEGDTKEFKHLPFLVTFMIYNLPSKGGINAS